MKITWLKDIKDTVPHLGHGKNTKISCYQRVFLPPNLCIRREEVKSHKAGFPASLHTSCMAGLLLTKLWLCFLGTSESSETRKVFFKWIFTFFFVLPIDFRLRWVFAAARRLSLVAESSVALWLRCVGFLLRCLCCRTQALSRVQTQVAATHRLSCTVAYGIFLEQGLNLGPLLWQADSLPTGPPGKSLNGSFIGVCVHVVL